MVALVPLVMSLSGVGSTILLRLARKCVGKKVSPKLIFYLTLTGRMKFLYFFQIKTMKINYCDIQLFFKLIYYYIRYFLFLFISCMNY